MSDSDDSDSDDSDTDSSDDDSDEDDDKRGSRFLAGADSDDDGDDDRRVVLSAKDKRLHELNAVCEEIRNKIKINDWITCTTLFDKMNKLWEKTQKMATLRGGRMRVPRVYLRVLLECEDALNVTLSNKELRKKMSTTNSKALNAMKQRLKKHNKDYETEIEALKARPVAVDGDDEDDDDDEDDEEEEEEDVVMDGGEDGDKAAKGRKDDIFTMNPADVTGEMVDEKVKEIALTRGKKSTDRLTTVNQLSALATLAKSTEQRLHVLLLVVSSIFDLNPSLSSTMSNATWQRTVVGVLDILNVLEENPTLFFADDTEGNPSVLADPTMKPIPGNLIAFVERIDDELFKTFQVTDPHTHEYVVRLQDEIKFLMLADRAAAYLTRIGMYSTLAKLSLRSLEHLYYKHANVYAAMRSTIAKAKADAAKAAENGDTTASAETAADEDEDEPKDGVDGEDESAPVEPFRFPESYDLPKDMDYAVRNLCKFIYKFGDERTKARAMLCDIYYKSIHDDFRGARDLMLMSHLQDVIQNMDILTQILFNRAMAQIGLAAFRQGFISEAHSCISEIHMGGKVKELLAQGVAHSRWHEKTPEQEKLEKRRQMPFHMHINLELLEAVHLTTAMLLEVSSMAQYAHEPNRKIISKNFIRLLENYERLTFTGPPENIRDHVMAAANLLSRGKWAECFEVIEKIPAWKLFPNCDEILSILRRKIQEEALKSYLFTNARCYASLSLAQLSEIFGMESKHVQSVISKLIMSEDLHGSWDQTTGTLLMHASEPTRLQSLSMQYSDKLSILMETNERALELRGGGRLTTNDDDGDRRESRDNRRFDRDGRREFRNNNSGRGDGRREYRNRDGQGRGGGGGGGGDRSMRSREYKMDKREGGREMVNLNGQQRA